MGSGIFDYGSSILNPLLKIIVPLLYVVGMIYFDRAREKHTGVVAVVGRRFAMVGTMGILAGLFRYTGDSFIQSKWGESLFFLAFALVNLYAVWPLMNLEAIKAESKPPQANG